MKKQPSANELLRQIENLFTYIRELQEEVEMKGDVHHAEVKRLSKKIREAQAEILKKQRIINKLNK